MALSASYVLTTYMILPSQSYDWLDSTSLPLKTTGATEAEGVQQSSETF
jgi:hypothetical protein